MSTSRKKGKKLTDAEIDSVLHSASLAEPHEIKVAMSLRLDSDLYLELKRRAKRGECGGRYQTILNKLLREALFGEPLSARVTALERRVIRIGGKR